VELLFAEKKAGFAGGGIGSVPLDMRTHSCGMYRLSWTSPRR
jgi:hypothetical protein